MIFMVKIFEFNYVCAVTWRDWKVIWELRTMVANASVERSAPAIHAPANELWTTLLDGYIIPFHV